MGGVAKIVNTEKNKTYIFSSSRDIYEYIEEVETKLINGWHTNKELQYDYNKNPNAFKFKVLHVCNSIDEINRLQSIEIDRYWPNGYNKRRGKVSYEGGNTNPFVKKGLNENEFVMTDFMKQLFANLEESRLSQESKNIIKEKIDNGDIKSKFALNTEIWKQGRKEKLLDMVNKSGLKRKDKNKLNRKIKDGVIEFQYPLIKEIESIRNSYKNTPKSKTKSNKTSNKTYKPNNAKKNDKTKHSANTSIKNNISKKDNKTKHSVNKTRKNNMSNKDKFIIIALFIVIFFLSVVLLLVAHVFSL